MFKSIIQGMETIGFMGATSYLGRGFSLVRKPGLRRFVVIPLLINVLVFAVLGYLLFGTAMDWISSWTIFERFGDNWLVAKLQSVLRFIVGALLFIILIFAFSLLANIIGAPFNSLLAERVEMHLTGQSPTSEPSLLFLVKSIPKTLRSELSKIVYLILWSIPLLIIGFIPVINIVAPVLVFAFGAWMFALEYLDYPMGNHGHLFKDLKRSLKLKRSIALGFGSVVALFSMIPVVNLVIMPVAVAGATALYLDQFQT